MCCVSKMRRRDRVTASYALDSIPFKAVAGMSASWMLVAPSGFPDAEGTAIRPAGVLKPGRVGVFVWISTVIVPDNLVGAIWSRHWYPKLVDSKLTLFFGLTVGIPLYA